MPNIFLSYDRSDQNFALKLANDLKSAGTSLWIDQLDIRAGTRWDGAVEDALRACPSMLVVLLPESVKSQNVLDEVDFALEKEARIFPVVYRDCDVPLRLRRFQRIDFTRGYSLGLTRLLEELRASNAPSRAGEEVVKKPALQSHPRKISFASILGTLPPAKRAAVVGGIVLAVFTLVFLLGRSIGDRMSELGLGVETNLRPTQSAIPPAPSVASSVKLAVINRDGEVWARALDLSRNLIGGGLAERDQQSRAAARIIGRAPEDRDKFVFGDLNAIYVVTVSGKVWKWPVTATGIGNAEEFTNGLWGQVDSPAKYVFPVCEAFYVINDRGEVWKHDVVGNQLGDGVKLGGYSLFIAGPELTGASEEYVTYERRFNRILRINVDGQVWAHNLQPRDSCGGTMVEDQRRLTEIPPRPPQPRRPRYALSGEHLLVVDDSGRVFARELYSGAIDPAIPLEGPVLFYYPEDAPFILTYSTTPR
jgi:hypothetical protein